MSFINEKVPDFSVDAYVNEDFEKISLDSLKGHWSIFFFYPADFSFVCPTELEELADNYQKFKDLNCEIYSISTDSHFVHKAWADASKTIAKIKFPMLADTNGNLSRAFDVMVEEDGMALRGTFIINPEGVIKTYEVLDTSIARSADELLRKLQACQFVAQHGDKVCPAKWSPGIEPLSPTIDLVGKL